MSSRLRGRAGQMASSACKVTPSRGLLSRCTSSAAARPLQQTNYLKLESACPRYQFKLLCRTSLSDFKVDRTLNESAVSKMLVLLGTFEGKDGQAIVILARRHFPVDPAACSTMLEACALKETFNNDIYSKARFQSDSWCW